MSLKDVLQKYQDRLVFSGVPLVDPNQKGIDGDTPLHVACLDGSIEDAETLLNANADVNIRGDIGNTPLHVAVSFGHVELVKLLLSRGARADLRNEHGNSPLDLACLNVKRYQDIVSILSDEKSST